MAKYLICYGVTLLTLLVIDGIWLGVVAKNLYQEALAYHMAERINLVAAAAFYLLYPAGVVYLAGMPGLESGEWQDALLRGAVLGLVAYGTYDLTNLATFKSFPMHIALIDMVWGAVLTGVAASAGVLIAKNMN
ncbi:MAG: DUF2177 family protein [Rhodospirillaceae bacterium]|nr:DUF2177 family protein [Rhodospirillaceae bacterium]